MEYHDMLDSTISFSNIPRLFPPIFPIESHETPEAPPSCRAPHELGWQSRASSEIPPGPIRKKLGLMRYVADI